MRDISIAKEALLRHELPLIGSFSSAGPFVFGPLYYWYLMLSYMILPNLLTSPWVINVLISISLIFVFYKLGEKFSDRNLGLIMAFLASISPQLVYRATGMSQHAFIPLFTALIILFYILLWKESKLKFAFWIGVFLGTALSMHFQAINLFIFFPAILFVKNLNFQQRIKALMLMTAGFVTPTLPNLIWDSHQQFANVRNLLDYLLIGQYRLYVPNSWKLFIFDYLPSYWAFVAGGFKYLSLPIIFLSFFIFVFSIFKKKITNVQLSLFVIFCILLLINRFYNGERSEGYLMYMLPFIILFSSYALEYFLVKNKPAGLAALTIIAAGSLSVAGKYTFQTDRHAKDFEKAENVIIAKFPDSKFSIFDYNWQYSDVSYGLMAFLKQKNKIDDKGMPIGVICLEGRKCWPGSPPIASLLDTKVIELRENPDFLTGKSWGNVNQAHIYDDLMQWQKRNKLSSNFNFLDFIFGRFGKNKKI